MLKSETIIYQKFFTFWHKLYNINYRPMYSLIKIINKIIIKKSKLKNCKVYNITVYNWTVKTYNQKPIIQGNLWPSILTVSPVNQIWLLYYRRVPKILLVPPVA